MCLSLVSPPLCPSMSPCALVFLTSPPPVTPPSPPVPPCARVPPCPTCTRGLAFPHVPVSPLCPCHPAVPRPQAPPGLPRPPPSLPLPAVPPSGPRPAPSTLTEGGTCGSHTAAGRAERGELGCGAPEECGGRRGLGVGNEDRTGWGGGRGLGVGNRERVVELGLSWRSWEGAGEKSEWGMGWVGVCRRAGGAGDGRGEWGVAWGEWDGLRGGREGSGIHNRDGMGTGGCVGAAGVGGQEEH